MMEGPETMDRRTAQSSGSRRAIALSGRAGIVITAIVLFFGAGVTAYRQAPRPDAYRQPDLLSFEWWRSPVERNPDLRLPEVRRALHDVITLPGTRRVWVIGAERVILHSRDGGARWIPQEVTEEVRGELLAEAAAAAMPDPAQQRILDGAAVPERPDDARQKGPEQQTVPGVYTVPVDSAVATADLLDGHFVDRRHGWVVGAYGTILATEDGGAAWRSIRLPLAPSWNAVHFADRTTGLVVGEEGLAVLTRDGGRSWRILEDLARLSLGAPLTAVRFVTRERAVVATAQDALLLTDDGGESWREVAAHRTGGPLLALDFLDERIGAALGPSGLLTTDDGGLSWRMHELPRNDAVAPIRPHALVFDESARALLLDRAGALTLADPEGGLWATTPVQPGLVGFGFADATRGWAVHHDGVIYATRDGGKSWFPQSRERPELLDIAARGRTIVAVGARGDVWRSRNGGASWTRTRPAGSLTAVHLVDASIGWAAGADSVVYRTTDGGLTWLPTAPIRIPDGAPDRSSSAGRAAVLDIHFHNADRGVVSREDGLYATSDGGGSWARVSPLGAVQLAWMDGRRGRALAVDHSMLIAENGDSAWARTLGAPGRIPEGLYRLAFADADTGWLIQASGLEDLGVMNSLHVTRDGGRSWTTLPSAATAGLPAVAALHFDDALEGWIIGRDGSIHRTRDGGASWTRTGVGLEDAVVTAVAYDPGTDRLWLTGDPGRLLTATPASASWRDPRVWRRYHAPWYYAGVGLLGLLLVGALGRKTAPPPEDSIEDRMFSDRPLEPEDHDPLRLGDLALGISRFLRNEKTQPPLTIAVSGAWGSGKSSLMNLVKADLERRGFRPVWFNAWHHQTEESLLAALLENIRARAVPPWWAPTGIPFRLRLLAIRGWRHWIAIGSLLVILGVSSGYLARHPDRAADAPAAIREHVVATAVGALRFLQGHPREATEPTAGEGAERGHDRWIEESLIAAVLSGLFLLFGALRESGAFRVNPASLLATAAHGVRVRRFEEQIGFRHRFAREFRDVTRALGARQMVVIIDDLDRCHPEQVLQVLEAVNFLATAGDCFIIMGMDIERVERSISYSFGDLGEDLLTELVPAPGKPRAAADLPTEDLKRLRRARFAHLYLEKLINIEVPVPALTVTASRQLVAPDDAAEPRASRWTTAAVLVRQVGRVGAPYAALLILAIGSFWLGFRDPGIRGTPANEAARATADLTVFQTGPGAAIMAEIESASRRVTSTLQGGAPVVLGQAATRSPMVDVTALLLLLTVTAWGLSRQAPVVEKDSPEFVRALRQWYPLIYGQKTTPRAVKRFLNRVRYYAMLQRTPSPDRRRVDRITDWIRARLGRTRPGPGGSARRARAGGRVDDPIPEAMLVALSAIQHYDPDWIREDDLFDDALAFLRHEGRIPAEIVKELRLDDSWRWIGRHRAAFENLSAGVRIL